MKTLEDKIKELGLELPPAPPLGGVYKPVIISQNMLYVSGQGPLQGNGELIYGKVGAELDTEQGYQAARQTGLTMLSTIKSQGLLNNIHRLIKTLGMVNCTMEFTEQPKVINGFSELMAEVLGEENGIGARSAVGMILPGNMAVEVEAIFELK